MVRNDTAELSLYRRLGGYDAIAAIIEELFVLLRTDHRIQSVRDGSQHRFTPPISAVDCDQICSLSGGPCYYIGRDMKTSHAGLGITEAEWTANLELTKQVLERRGIASREQVEFYPCLEDTKTTLSRT